MFRPQQSLFIAGLLSLSVFASSAVNAAPGWGIRADKSYHEVIQQVTKMPSNQDLQRRCRRYGLQVMNVMWEDTGRAAGSSLGPNISDLTLQVHEPLTGATPKHLLPVIRYPNFSDKTADVRADKIWIKVGNQNKSGQTVAVPLLEVLSNLKEYMSDPGSLRGRGNFITKRDSHFLVSAQHVFLPIPKKGTATFNPVLFNYQSAPQNPAVLTLLVTREGTSAAVIDNNHEDGQRSWGQQLYYNNAGQRTLFTAERKSTVKARIESGQAKASDKGALEEGADMMMIIQVPLKHKNMGYMMGLSGGGANYDKAMESAAPMSAPKKRARRRGPKSDVEQAVLGHGQDDGKFREMAGYKLVRDNRFPIRITVQFYKATSNGVVSDQDLKEVSKSIKQVYTSGDYVGSLVMPRSQHQRPTDWIKDHPEAARRWKPFKKIRRFFIR